MSPQVLRNSQVEVAAKWAGWLCRSEAAETGLPMSEALKRVARRTRVAPNFIWSLLYRPPVDVLVGPFEALQGAMERQILKEINALEHELHQVRFGSVRTDPAEVEEISAGIATLKARLRSLR